MLLQCPKCGQQAEVPTPSAGRSYSCSSCNLPLEAIEAPLPRVKPVLARPPVFVPVPTKKNPFEFSEEDEEERQRDRKERRQERREERDDRRDERQIRGLERKGNMLGIASLAVATTTFLLVLSGLLFVKRLPFYAGSVGTLSLPGSVAGLIAGIIATLRPGRSRIFGSIATGTCGLLILLLIPALWIGLTDGVK